MKNKRMILDIIMTVLLIVMMGYHLWSNFIHEWLGIILCLLFILHHIWNRKWYTTLFKGRHTLMRIFQIIINTCLLISMICTAVSGFIISRDVLNFIDIGGTSLGRTMHLISSSWLYILMSIHIGLHLNGIIAKFKKSSFCIKYSKILNIVIIAVLIYGLFVFYQRDIWKDMFFMTEFKFFDFSEMKVSFYFDYLLIMVTFSLIGNKILRLLTLKRRNG
ncbi:MAG: DUF4405 domain-containing protein [Thomasclavelia spiroformis]